MKRVAITLAVLLTLGGAALACPVGASVGCYQQQAYTAPAYAPVYAAIYAAPYVPTLTLPVQTVYVQPQIQVQQQLPPPQVQQ